VCVNKVIRFVGSPVLKLCLGKYSVCRSPSYAGPSGLLNIVPEGSTVAVLLLVPLLLLQNEHKCLEGMSAVAIHMRLVEVFGSIAIAYSSVTQISRSASCTCNFSAGPRRPANQQFEELIFDALENDLNAFVCQIVDVTRIPRTTVFMILANLLWFA
jgi:hypothetical protein